MAQTNYFPVAQLDTAIVNFLGFWHGFPGYEPTNQVKRTIGRQVASFNDHGLWVVEGSPYQFGKTDIIYQGELQQIPTENDVDFYKADFHQVRAEDNFEGEQDLVIQFLLKIPAVQRRMEDLDLRTDRPEFYVDSILWNPEDKQIRSTQVGSLDYDKDALVEQWAHVTYVTPEEIKALKQAEIDALDGKVEDVTRDQIALYVEKKQTLRSLLLARTSSYRAEALGRYGPAEVELGLGCMHAGEAYQFLTDPETVGRYLLTAPEEILDIYKRNEEIQKEITEVFHATVGGQGLNPKERAQKLKEIVDIEMRGIMEKIAPPGTRIIHL